MTVSRSEVKERFDAEVEARVAKGVARSLAIEQVMDERPELVVAYATAAPDPDPDRHRAAHTEKSLHEAVWDWAAAEVAKAASLDDMRAYEAAIDVVWKSEKGRALGYLIGYPEARLPVSDAMQAIAKRYSGERIAKGIAAAGEIR